MSVRSARQGDLEGILRLYAQLHPTDPIDPVGARSAFERILADDALRILVLEVDGKIAATSYLSVIPNLTRSASPFGIVENVVVDESQRGAGLGKQLMRETLVAAWEAGCYKVELTTGSQRESTHAFYRACGLSADEKAAYIVRRPAL